jgi:CPA2 family monovalent cation:H+ antiporter-2
MHEFDLIATLTGGLVAAVIGGYVTQRLQLSPIVGYLLAGIVVGPYTPGFVADRELAEQLAEIGVVLLMFGVGLQFHVEDLFGVALSVASTGVRSGTRSGTRFGTGSGTRFGTRSGTRFGTRSGTGSGTGFD